MLKGCSECLATEGVLLQLHQDSVFLTGIFVPHAVDNGDIHN